MRARVRRAPGPFSFRWRAAVLPPRAGCSALYVKTSIRCAARVGGNGAISSCCERSQTGLAYWGSQPVNCARRFDSNADSPLGLSGTSGMDAQVAADLASVDGADSPPRRPRWRAHAKSERDSGSESDRGGGAGGQGAVGASAVVVLDDDSAPCTSAERVGSAVCREPLGAGRPRAGA